MEGRFTLEDFLEQLQQVRKLGSLGGVMKLLPGMSKEMRQAADQIDDGEISRVEAIVRSMTPKERVDPSVVDGSRRVRIAHGSGTSTQDVNQLLKQFREMQKMMKGMAGGGGLPGLGGMPGMGGGGQARRRSWVPASSSALSSSPESTADWPAVRWGVGRAAGRGRAQVSAGRVPVGLRRARRQGVLGVAPSKKKKGGRVTPPKAR